MADSGAHPPTERPKASTSQFALPPLPYLYGDLEPIISARALEIHHARHHARYVETMNRVLTETQTVAHSVEDAVRTAQRRGQVTLFNNAAQTWNHAFFWQSMRPGYSRPEGRLADAIGASFGSAETLGKRFAAEGTGHFGSGWVWLVAQGRELVVLSTHDCTTPVTNETMVPLLTCDVWEHAYYLDYQQDRAKWLGSWWDVLANWEFAELQYQAALGQGHAWRFPDPSIR
ncbi:MAG TPA: superoxide dismutase [Novosphingobium sp.]